MVFRGLQVFRVVDEELPALPDLLDQEVCPECRAFPEKTDTQVNWDHAVSRAPLEDRVFPDNPAGRDHRVRRETRANRDSRDCPAWRDPRVTPAPRAPRESRA